MGLPLPIQKRGRPSWATRLSPCLFCAPPALLLRANTPGWSRNGGTKWTKTACSADARTKRQLLWGRRAGTSGCARIQEGGLHLWPAPWAAGPRSRWRCGAAGCRVRTPGHPPGPQRYSRFRCIQRVFPKHPPCPGRQGSGAQRGG